MKRPKLAPVPLTLHADVDAPPPPPECTARARGVGIHRAVFIYPAGPSSSVGVMASHTTTVTKDDQTVTVETVGSAPWFVPVSNVKWWA